jgi:hypothetical protein
MRLRLKPRKKESNMKPMNLHLKKGALHKEMGIASGKKIPVSRLQKEKSKGGLAAKRANFALNARKWNHSGRKMSSSWHKKFNKTLGS